LSASPQFDLAGVYGDDVAATGVVLEPVEPVRTLQEPFGYVSITDAHVSVNFTA
jgi:hypothetical protein